MSKISVDELKELFVIEGDVLIWNVPTMGKRINGRPAGCVNKVGKQIVVEIQGRPYPASNIIWAINTGKYPKYKIEHINGKKTDNRMENLREKKPYGLEVTKNLLERVFEYKSGFLYWKDRPTSSSRVSIGEIAGYVMKNGTKHEYRYIKIGGVRYKAANLIWMIHTGIMPNMLDHIDHNPQNDDIENLREADHTENARNTEKRITNTSGTVGVNWNKSHKRWVARINGDNGKRIELGLFRDKENAISARKAAEIMLKYHENHGK